VLNCWACFRLASRVGYGVADRPVTNASSRSGLTPEVDGDEAKRRAMPVAKSGSAVSPEAAQDCKLLYLTDCLYHTCELREWHGSVVRHHLHPILADAGEWREASISLGLWVARDAVDGSVDLLILCRWHSSSQFIAVPARFRRRTVVEPFCANHLIAPGEGCVFQRLANIAIRQPPDGLLRIALLRRNWWFYYVTELTRLAAV